MEWLSDYDHLKEHGDLSEGSTLLQHINNRIGWEIFSEYGFQTRIGRTLEKTSSSVVYLDPWHLEQATERMLEAIQNEIGLLRRVERF